MENKAKDAIELLHLLCGNSGCVISDSGGKKSKIGIHGKGNFARKGIPFMAVSESEKSV